MDTNIDPKSGQISPPLPVKVPLLLFGSVLALELLGRIVGGIWTWGINLWTVLPIWSMLLALAVYLALSYSPIENRLVSAIVRLTGQRRSRQVGLPVWTGWLGLVFLSAIAGWFSRSSALVYGDGFAAVKLGETAAFAMPVGIHELIRPLSVFMLAIFKVTLPDSLSGDPMLLFWIMTIAGGVVGILALAKIVIELYDELAGRITAFILALAGASTMLLLGWVELYVWPTAALLWVIASAILHLKCKAGIWLLLATGLVSILFHLVLLPVVGTAIVVTLKQSHSQIRIARFLPGPKFLFTILLVASIVGGLVLQLTETYFTVPLFSQDGYPYSLISLEHLRDMLNLILHIAPVGAAVVVLALISKRFRTGLSTPFGSVLASITWATFLVSLWIDPKLGAARDWDLLGWFGLPLSLLGGYLLMTAVPLKIDRIRLSVQATIVTIILLIPQLYEKQRLEAAVARIEPITSEDIHYHASYQKAFGCIAWGTILFEECGRADLGEKYFRRRVQAEPNHAFGWFNLGVVAYRRGNFEASADLFAKALDLDPGNRQYINSLQSAQTSLFRQRMR